MSNDPLVPWSRQVVEEIIEAIEEERKEGALKLVPIAINDAVFNEEVARVVGVKLSLRHRREDWTRYLRDYHIPDFSGWKDHDTYQKELTKLLEALRKPAKR